MGLKLIPEVILIWGGGGVQQWEMESLGVASGSQLLLGEGIAPLTLCCTRGGHGPLIPTPGLYRGCIYMCN